MTDDSPFLIRLAEANDDDFIMGLVPRFVGFELPPWRRRNECIEGIRKDTAHHLQDLPPNSFLFVAEDAGDGRRVGFLHLQKTQDFFNGRTNCHISDLVVADGDESRGIGRALLAHAEDWARQHRCHMVTLALFPGNLRARKLYEAGGYGVDLVRMGKPVR